MMVFKNNSEYSCYLNLPSSDDSRFATDEEMKSNLLKLDITKNCYPSGGIPIMSDGKTAFIDATDTHSLILGATGSKKSRLLCMPMIHIMARAGESFIATDPKGELFESASGILKKEGYKTIVLNFREPSFGDSWNPLSIPYEFYKQKKYDKASELINDFTYSLVPINHADAFWDNSARNLCSGLLQVLFACAGEKQINVSSLNALRLCIRNEVENGEDDDFSTLFKILDDRSISKKSLTGTMNAAPNTRASILVSLDQNIKIFSSQVNLLQMLSESSFDMNRIGIEKTAIFLIMPDEKSTTHFLVSLFIKQCYETLIRVAQSLPGKTLPIRTNFILDEFANIPHIPDMPSMITAARSRNIRFYLVVQSEKQLKKRYKDEAGTLKGNCNNWVFLTSRELELLKEISDLCGIKKKIIKNTIVDIQIMSISQLQRLSKDNGEALVLCGRQYPYVTNLADIDDYQFTKYESVKLKKRADKAISIFELSNFLSRHTAYSFSRLFKHELSQFDC